MTEAKRLTDSDITALIDRYWFDTHGTLTICVILLKNGATVTGESRPISDANFNAERGQQAAYDKARDKIWELEGYAVRRDNAKYEAEVTKIEARFAEINEVLGQGPREDWMQPLIEEFAFLRGRLSIVKPS